MARRASDFRGGGISAGIRSAIAAAEIGGLPPAADFMVEVETIRSVRQAAEDGKIGLRASLVGGPGGRGGKRSAASRKTLPDAAIAEFLGGNYTRDRVQRCTSALRELGEGVRELYSVGRGRRLIQSRASGL